MPNVFDRRSNEQLRNIENNRYFFQSKNGQPLDPRNECLIHTTRTLDTMLRDSEIRAQLSHFNLNDIGKSHENIVVFNKTVTKHAGMAQAMSCLDFTKSRETLNSSISRTKSCKTNGPKPYVSTSSPQLKRGGISSAMTISPPKMNGCCYSTPKDGFVVPRISNRTKTEVLNNQEKLTCTNIR